MKKSNQIEMDELKNNKADMTNEFPGEMFEKPPLFPFLLRRFLEILIPSIVASAPIAFLYQMNILPTTIAWGYRAFGFSLFVFVALNIYMLRSFFYSMGNMKVYFRVNLVAYAIFAAVNLLILCIFRDDGVHSLYSYLFTALKFWTLIIEEVVNTENNVLMYQIIAAVMTHIIMVGLIFAAPMEMYKMEKKKR